MKENGEIKKKKSFLNRRSLLDDYYCDSSISLSDFRGFYTAGVIFGVFYLLTDPILRYLNKGEIFPLVFINTFKKDYFLCLAHWPLYYLFSYTALGIQKAIIKGLNVNIALVLSNLTEFTLFGYTYFITMGREWGSTHAMFVSFICCTHYFKMHSYKEMNKKYRESRDPCYPLNVTIENFTLYMWMPVLVYEPHFPRNMTIDFKYIVYKSFIGALGILFAYIICCDNIIPYTS